MVSNSKQIDSISILSGILRILDRVLNIFLCISLVVALFYGGYALWDTWKVYRGATNSDEILAFRPNGTPEDSASFEALRAINPEICAWIAIDNTRINYPIVQGKDNSCYLDQNIYGEYSLSGSIFLDSRNANDFTDRYSLLYGHHMDGGAMFGDMDLFQDEDFFQENTTGWLYLPDTTYKIHILAYIQVDAFNGPMYTIPTTKKGVNFLCSYYEENAIYSRERETDGPLIGLSTCTTAATNGRKLLIGELTEVSREVDTGGKELDSGE